MENELSPQNTKYPQNIFPGPWPCYVLLIIGFALTGFFPWLMLSWSGYKRGKKLFAILSLVINFAVYIFFAWWLLKVKISWWWLTSLAYLFNLAWSFTAYLFQKKLMGCAQKRYMPAQWRTWVTPLLVGAVLGICVATVLSMGPAFVNRIEMREMLDSLDRNTVLWDFFRFSLAGVSVGLLVGFWWGGDGKRFRADKVITFFGAMVLTITIWSLLGFLLNFFIHKGIMIKDGVLIASHWEIVPPWITGVRKYIFQIQNFDISSLIVISLFFGSVSRIREFLKRAILIPLTFFLVLPISFGGNEWWTTIQDQVIYDMSSPDDNVRAKAHDWAEIILERYPNHLQWPEIAENLARYYYQEGDYGKSKNFYQRIIKQQGDPIRWQRVLERSRTALSSPDFGKPSLAGPKPAIPMVDYEEYLTHNWMTLLSVIRYWQGPKVAESQVKIGLKDLSGSDDRITLSPLVSLADLHDAARGLNYEVMILPAELKKVKALLKAGIPVIHHCHNSFNLIFGFDESRSALLAYSFISLSKRLMVESRKEAQEILAIKEEGCGESKKRLLRIAREAYGEYSADYWESPALRYSGPFIAIIYPATKAGKIATALNTNPDTLKQKSGGYLASLIGLAYLNHASPVQAVEWAKVGAEKTTDPLPLYIAHLSKLLWQSRNKKTGSKIPLEKQFPELAQIFTYFNEPENLAFLKRARLRFQADIDHNVFPQNIPQHYLPLLDRSNPSDLKLIVKIIQRSLTFDPVQSQYWQLLADTYEWSEDIPRMVIALKGLVSSNPLDSRARLRLAYGFVLLEKFAEADGILSKINSRQVRYDADYFFCRGAVAEWEGKKEEALEKYEKAVEMRRYKPIYYLRYGRLLLKEGMNKKAIKALEWAVRIDAGDKVTIGSGKTVIECGT